MQYGVNVSPIKGSSEKFLWKKLCFLYFVSFMFYL